MNRDQHRASSPPVRILLGVTLYWLAWSWFWGALLTIILPSIVQTLAPENKDFALGLTLGIGAAVGATVQIIAGSASDLVVCRFGRRIPFLMTGTILAVIPVLALQYANSLMTLAVVYVLIQFTLNIAIGPYQALIPDLIPPNYYGRASAYMGIWSLVGRIGGPALAAALIVRPQGMPFLFAALAGLLLAFALVTTALTREPLYQPTNENLLQHICRLYKLDLKNNPDFKWVTISRFGIMTGFYSALPFLLYYVQYCLDVTDSAEATKVVAQFLALSTVTGVIGILPAGRLSDRISKKMVFVTANLICAAAAVIFIVAHALPTAFIAVAIFGVGFGAFTVIDWALGCSVVPSHSRARYLGFWSLSDTIPQVFAPLVAGLLAASVNNIYPPGGGYRAIMFLAIFFFALGTVAIRNARVR